MKIAGAFNTVGPGNIGVENLLHCGGGDEITLFVFSQEKREAEAFLSESYPDRQVEVFAWSGLSKRTLVEGVRHIVSGGFDVVHAHHASAAMISAVARFKGSFGFLTTAHANFNSYSLSKKIMFLFAFFVSDHVVCNSKSTLLSLPKLIRRKKTSVVYNGVNFEKLDKVIGTCSNADGPSPSPLLIGTLARLVSQKDLSTLLRAFHEVREKTGKVVYLRIVGDGPERESLEGLSKSLGLNEHVEFTGSLSRENAYGQLAEMSIFVVSSRWEGFCNAMVEAGAAKKAIVASNVAPLPEVIGKDNALFFDVSDHRALADRVLELIESQSRRKELGGKACRFTRSRYSLDVSAAKYREVYKALSEA